MPTLKEIKQQIKDLPHKYIFYTKREIKYLPKILVEGEKILALTSGYLGNRTVLLVCTTRRLLFIDKGMFFGLKVQQANLDRIQSIESSYVIVMGSIKIWDGATSYQINAVWAESIDPFVKTVRTAIDAYKRIMFKELTTSNTAQMANATTKIATPHKPIDVTQQLERIAKLKDQGHLTQAEFEQQKRKLLED